MVRTHAMKQTRPYVTIAAILAVAVFSAACSGSEGSGEALADIRSRSETSSYERIYDSIPDLVELIVERHDSDKELGTVITGTISSVEKGAGFRWELTEDGNEEKRIELPYGDPEAMINTVHATIKVEELLAPHSDRRDTEFIFGLAFSPRVPFEAAVGDLKGLGDVVVFLDSSPVFDYRPGLYGVVENGQLIGVAQKDGSVDFPLAEDELTGSDVTIDLLKSSSHNN